jgi:hypothetical protein
MMDGSMRAPARTLLTAVITMAMAWSGACATGVQRQRPATGGLTVGVTTTGGAASSMTFRVTIEPAGIGRQVKADAGVFTSDDIPFGEHVVRLSEVPASCRVDGGAERKITISDNNRIVAVRFEVRCGVPQSAGRDRVRVVGMAGFEPTTP